MSSEKSRGNVIVNAIAKFLKVGAHTKAKRKCIAAVLPQNSSDHQSVTMTMTPPRGPQLQDITNRQQVQQQQQQEQQQQQQQQQQQLLHSSLPQSQTQPWSQLHSQLQLQLQSQLHSQLQSQLQTQVDCQSQPQSQPHPQPQTQSQLRSQSRSKIQLQPQSLPPTEPQSLPPTEPQSLPPMESQCRPATEPHSQPTTKPQSRPPSKIHLQSQNESRIANNTRPKNNGAAAQASEKNSTEQNLSNVNESDRSSVTVPPVTIPSKHTARDFIFGKVIGEGSFSTVYLAKGVHCRKEYAIKVCEKRHILKEHKTEYIKREKEVLNLLSDNACPTAPFFVKLFSTFQDSDRLYFVLSYAKNGELLPYIHKVGSFDIECSRFYAGEILHALEHLHSLGIIHRDLKPENILLDDKMHIKITDFGSVKILEESPLLQDGNFSLSNSLILDESASVCDGAERYSRRNSFVGTAQYVSPELLSEKSVSKSSDIWALGCIIYQMVAGLPPFVARSEYVIFQKILQVIYEFPDGFDPDAKDLVQKLLIRDPQERLGSSDEGIYTSIRCQPFFKGIDFETLYLQIPPPIYPYLPGTSDNEEMRSHYRVPDHLEPGLDDRQLTRLLGLDLQESEPERYETTGNFPREKSELMEKPETTERQAPEPEKHRKRNGIMDLSPEEIRQRLEQQQRESKWHDLVERNLILKQGLVDKRKGLFVRRRMLLLTMGPHLYYADPVDMVLKGEIPWSPELRVEPKNFKIFFVHTPNRTYYLEDRDGYALEWCKAIEDVRKYKYGLRL